MIKYLSKDGKNFKVSEHFTLGELASPDSDKVIYNPALLIKLEEMRKFFGGTCRITSFYRSPAYNAKVGGASNSAHLEGNAVDFVFTGKDGKRISAKQVCVYLESTKWKYGIGYMGTATHIDTKFKGNHMDETRKDPSNGSGYFLLNKHKLTFSEYFGYPIMQVKSKTLNVRNAPSINGKKVGILLKGKKVFIYKTVKDSNGDEWAKINFAKPKYVAKWLLK